MSRKCRKFSYVNIDYSKRNQKLTKEKAIRLKCLECSCGQLSEIQDCLVKTCSLYPFRLGAEQNVSKTENKRKKRTVVCKLCGQQGHIAKTCQNNKEDNCNVAQSE